MKDSLYEVPLWVSADTSIATVDQCGVVTAKKAGKVQIALIIGQEMTAYTCNVTVTDPSKSTIKKGNTYTVKGIKYKVTSKAKSGGNVTVTGPSKKTVKTISIPATVKIKGETFKVTAISYKAFYNCKKLWKVKIGTNVKTIGKMSFYKCRNLSRITFGKNITTIGYKAFSGIYKKAHFKVPSSKKKAYKKKLSYSRGYRKTMKIVK